MLEHLPDPNALHPVDHIEPEGGDDDTGRADFLREFIAAMLPGDVKDPVRRVQIGYVRFIAACRVLNVPGIADVSNEQVGMAVGTTGANISKAAKKWSEQMGGYHAPSMRRDNGAHAEAARRGHEQRKGFAERKAPAVNLAVKITIRRAMTKLRNDHKLSMHELATLRRYSMLTDSGHLTALGQVEYGEHNQQYDQQT
jgi:hypothetical protein